MSASLTSWIEENTSRLSSANDQFSRANRALQLQIAEAERKENAAKLYLMQSIDEISLLRAKILELENEVRTLERVAIWLDASEARQSKVLKEALVGNISLMICFAE
jgi:hypothetical protein